MSNRFYAGQKDYIQQLNLLDDQMQAGAGGSVSAGVTSFNSRSGPITLTFADVIAALGFTPYSAANPSGYVTSAGLTAYAPKASPAFTGVPTAPTAAAGTDTVQLATCAYARRVGAIGAGTSATTFSATPNFNCASQNVFDITLTGNVTGATLSNPTDGQRVLVRVKQDATGGRTFAFAAGQVRFSADLPSLAVASGAALTTYIGLCYNLAASRFDVVSVNKGF